MKNIFLIGFCVFFFIQTYAQKKGYKTYKVKKEGETLLIIAKRHFVTIEDLQDVNANLINKELKLGQKVYIPLSKLPVKKEDNKRYIYHYVKPKETLYSLSKKYNISIQKMILDNPFLDRGLQIQDSLIIPVPLDTMKFKLHYVAKKETIYGLLRKYKITKQELYQNNPKLSLGLKYRQYLLIPKDKKKIDITLDKQITNSTKLNGIINSTNVVNTKITNANQTKVIDNFIFLYDNVTHKKKVNLDTVNVTGETLNIALMLPLYLYSNDTISVNKYTGIKPIYPKSNVALEFYTGVMTAIDSLKNMGVSTNVKVYDTCNNSDTIVNILQNNDFSNFDLCIGPLYKKNVEVVAKHFKSKNSTTMVVSPLSKKYTIKNNDNVIQVSPTHKILSEKSIDYLMKNYKDEDVIMTYTPEFYQQISYITQKLQPLVDSMKLKHFLCSNEGLVKDSIFNYIKPFKKHIFIVATNDNIIVSDLINNLYSFQDTVLSKVVLLKNYNIVNKLESEYLSHVNLHYPISYYLDYHKNGTKKMINLYRKKNKRTPPKYAMIGFDVILDTALRYITDNFEDITQGEYSGFNYIKMDSTGYLNKALYIIEHKNLEIKKHQLFK